MNKSDQVNELRVLIFAPVGRDAALTSELLGRASIPCHVCNSLAELCVEIERGAGAVLLTEESLDHPQLADLTTTLEQQPAWSDISVLLFAGSDRSQASLRTLRLLEMLRNVTLLDRPIRVAAVISTVRAALRGRRRQHELRDVLVELHAAREDAERANRLKDEFLATLSHELRTPLNAILGWVSMLRQGKADNSQLTRILGIIDRNARAQSQLVNDVLDVSRMVTGRMILERGTVRLARVVSNAIESIKPAADAKDITLRVNISDDLAPVLGDAERLQQVCWNLLANAVKFTPENGRIDVRVARAGSHVEVAISDTGIGLSADFLPFAFERFRQGDQSITRTHGGLGLGLAIVKHLVDLHGGQVSAESAGEGQGATFRVRLPVQGLVTDESWHPEEGPRPTAGAAADADFEDRLILVVEDDLSTRELLTALLTSCNARVSAAQSAQEAMSLLEGEVPAAIVADLGMPGEDGLSLMKRIRELPESQGGAVPSLALSAYTRGEDRARALVAGFDEFLTKPALPDDLVRAVERLLRRERKPRWTVAP
jgi:signal transduction histidine kinase/CheY-like chemotaxis protein